MYISYYIKVYYITSYYIPLFCNIRGLIIVIDLLVETPLVAASRNPRPQAGEGRRAEDRPEPQTFRDADEEEEQDEGGPPGGPQCTERRKPASFGLNS